VKPVEEEVVVEEEEPEGNPDRVSELKKILGTHDVFEEESFEKEADEDIES
jgi:hypothetical protein